jgi:hypothetical protein
MVRFWVNFSFLSLNELSHSRSSGNCEDKRNDGCFKINIAGHNASRPPSPGNANAACPSATAPTDGFWDGNELFTMTGTQM